MEKPEFAPRHPIQVVARRTGLTADLLRAWERRYGAVQPGRTETGRRLYSDADVERLVLLRSVTAGGRPIRYVAQLSADELRDLMQEDIAAHATLPRSAPFPKASSPNPSASFLDRALDAVDSMNRGDLRSVLDQAVLAMGWGTFVADVVVPLLETVGTRWEHGRIRVGHEHMATAVLESFLTELLRVGDSADPSRVAVIATPAGQRHQLGALLAASEFVALGWSVVYLGADVPAADLAAAVRQAGAQVLALSIVYPENDTWLPGELRTLRSLLPAGTAIVAGGRGVHAFDEVLRETGAEVIADLSRLGDHFAGLG